MYTFLCPKLGPNVAQGQSLGFLMYFSLRQGHDVYSEQVPITYVSSLNPLSTTLDLKLHAWQRVVCPSDDEGCRAATS